jgi:CRP/FNR family transcriptional regulator, cyclic AMP receptor protein
MPKAPVSTRLPSERDVAADPRTWSNVLETVPLFSALSRRHLKKVAATGRIARFHDRTAIVRSGEPGDTLYVVLDGDVLVSKRGARELRLGMGSFFGELALLDGGARSATVLADGPVVCLAIKRQRFAKVLRAEPSIAIAMLGELASRLRAGDASR